jgi:nitrogen fixation/metabolism regulation signal transduction histidine kinase
MKEVNLGKNEVIAWKRNDEIGDLVAKYNEMVLKLEDSAAMLAKSEREGAWREMARQVAHEIKNPLTPMKLSIQYLQKSIAEGSDNVQGLTASVTQTLVEQIDHLSKIAADFSQFANIGNSKAEPILLSELLKKIADLFSMEPGAVIRVSDDGSDCIIRADRTQINRLLTNLVKNALQAYDDATYKPVELHVSKFDSQFATVRIRDFGPGIDESVHDKIFTPNFTTKTSGTGLGLAISKGIAEQAGGEIWFETGADGTSFFVKLPLADVPPPI